MTAWKSTGAILAGFVAIVALSAGTDAILEATGVFPPFKVQFEQNYVPANMLIVATIYRIVYSVAGCYLAARLAPSRPMRHAMILGAVGVVVTTIGTIVMWGHGPAWYPILLIVVSLPCAWFGGKLRTA
jgi:hypothetical protein